MVASFFHDASVYKLDEDALIRYPWEVPLPLPLVLKWLVLRDGKNSTKCHVQRIVYVTWTRRGFETGMESRSHE